MTDDTAAALRAYLEQHFPGAAIEIARGGDDDRYLCTITAESGQYRLAVLDEAFSGPGFTGVAPQLESFGAAQVMRDMAGFPVTVTANGCVFEDV
ncbi:MAG: hypothetical protein OXU50_04210 [Gammaproteobacteria bacterium]|nr:hypothetical protein [Gammaproteobacteria bacterium]